MRAVEAEVAAARARPRGEPLREPLTEAQEVAAALEASAAALKASEAARRLRLGAAAGNLAAPSTQRTQRNCAWRGPWGDLLVFSAWPAAIIGLGALAL